MRGAFGVVVLAVREAPGSSLLHAARAALASGAAEVVVVVGSEAARRGLKCLPVRTVLAEGGLGDSIAAGVAALSPYIEGVVVTLANRARVTPRHLRALAAALNRNATIVASAYEGTVGVPAAFARTEFPRLLALRGEEGAKALLQGAATLALAGANVRTTRPARCSAPDRLSVRRADPRRCLQVSRAPPSEA